MEGQCDVAIHNVFCLQLIIFDAMISISKLCPCCETLVEDVVLRMLWNMSCSI